MPGIFLSTTVNGGFQDFLNALITELRNGLFLFSSPWDIFISALDIAVTTAALYYILRLISETRAWQLLKGLILLFLFTFLAGALGLGTINYVLVNSVSVLALGLVVIFQPELRRALETVGRNSANMFMIHEEETTDGKLVHNIIESIAVACDIMSKECTGALIIIERQTKLGDLIESGTAVVLDAELTSAALRQIFFKNSPMHDGAVLIRKGRIYATRVHVPLSDTYQLRREMGTRHRAAIGASEIGDAIAIVCSEEHGTISIAVRGRLYTLEDADALRAVLQRMLGVKAPLDERSLPRRLRKLLRIDRAQTLIKQKPLTIEEQEAVKLAEAESDQAANPAPQTKQKNKKQNDVDEIEAGEYNTADIDSREVTEKPKRSKALLLALALCAAICLWLYVRITTNPIVSKTFTVQIQTVQTESLEKKHLDFFTPVKQVTLTVMGRENVLRDLSENKINASIDLSQVNNTGIVTLPIKVSIDDISNLNYSVTWKNPDQVTVSIYQEEKVGTISENGIAVKPTAGGQSD